MTAFTNSSLTMFVKAGFLLMMMFVVSSASDMSIINYDENHGLFPSPPKRTDEEVRAMFESWLIQQKKNYNSVGEKQLRFQIFKDNLAFIDQQNAMNHSYTLGLTDFADLTDQEYSSKYVGEPFSLSEMDMFDIAYEFLNVGQLPDSVDWRPTGAIGPIRNQGSCGCCWAFAAAAAVEALHHNKTGNFVVLSPQQLLDCTGPGNNCSGGRVSSAFKFIKSNGGITSDAKYPYKMAQGVCDPSKPSVASIGGHKLVPRNNERALQAAIVNQPVTVLVQANNTAFKSYKGGILDSVDCKTKVDHAILGIGYGTENGVDYWLVKNQHGTNWGDKGFGKIRRNYGTPEGMCGIATWPFYPTK